MKMMEKTLPTILIAAVAVLFSLSFADMVFAAELNLKKFTASPSPFQKRQTIRFSLEIENPNATSVSTAGREIIVSVKDGTPERESPGGSRLSGGTPLPPTISARSTITVNLTQTYTVPNNAGDQIQFTIFIPAIPPGQLGASYAFKFNASCTYSPELRTISRPVEVGPVR